MQQSQQIASLENKEFHHIQQHQHVNQHHNSYTSCDKQWKHQRKQSTQAIIKNNGPSLEFGDCQLAIAWDFLSRYPTPVKTTDETALQYV